MAEPDLLITFLTGNGLYIPYHNDFPVHREYATKFLRQFHNDFPNALIGVMGLNCHAVMAELRLAMELVVTITIGMEIQLQHSIMING